MLTPLFRTLVLAALLTTLAACGNSPQQPSDVVDDQSTVASGDTTTRVPDKLNEPDNQNSDPVATGSVAKAPASLASVTGRWVASGNTCEQAGAVVAITQTRYESLERNCDIADAVGASGSLTVGLRCPGADGNVDSELVKLTPTDSGLDISVVGGDAGPQSFVHCP